jgi:hypothetical protein
MHAYQRQGQPGHASYPPPCRPLEQRASRPFMEQHTPPAGHVVDKRGASSGSSSSSMGDLKQARPAFRRPDGCNAHHARYKLPRTPPAASANPRARSPRAPAQHQHQRVGVAATVLAGGGTGCTARLTHAATTTSAAPPVSRTRHLTSSVAPLLTRSSTHGRVKRSRRNRPVQVSSTKCVCVTHSCKYV